METIFFYCTRGLRHSIMSEKPAPAFLQYSELVNIDLSGNAVNFADAELNGHRVLAPIAVEDLNTYFKWIRTIGSDRPVGYVDSLSDFTVCLLVALSEGFVDVDGVSNGLCFSSGALQNTENQTYTANDLVMAYVLFKLYGDSSFDTSLVTYNTMDALNMVTSEDVAAAIGISIAQSNDRGLAVDQMFQNLLEADPSRFFDASGVQLTGLFETTDDVSGDGSWNYVENDRIEIVLIFTFHAPVTRRNVLNNQINLQETPLSTQPFEEIIIATGETFQIRLQLLATAERSARRIASLSI